MNNKQVTDIANLYKSIYEEKEENLNENPLLDAVRPTVVNAVRPTVVNAGGEVGAQLGRGKAGPLGGYFGRRKGEKTAGTAFDQATSGNFGGAVRTVQDALRETKDSFDIVKGHLIDEGYADTEEAALVIMANMSEEWRQSIIEEVGIVGPPKKPIDAIPGVRALRTAASNTVKRSDYGPNDEVKKVGKHVVPSGRLGGQFDRSGGTKYKDISGDK